MHLGLQYLTAKSWLNIIAVPKGAPTALKKNSYAMRTCVCYLEIEQSHGERGNARFANEGH